MTEPEKNPYTVWTHDIRELPPGLGDPDCDECDGFGVVSCDECDGDGQKECDSPCCDGSHDCGGCGGDGSVKCPECLGKRAAAHESIKAWVAAEATRLWRRDVGRGITTGTKATYIGFAFDSIREQEAA